MKRMINLSLWLLALAGLVLWVSFDASQGKLLTGPLWAFLCIVIYMGTSSPVDTEKDP